jgi:hypothetical protein
MKKKTRRLSLNKDTLRSLSGPGSRVVGGSYPETGCFACATADGPGCNSDYCQSWDCSRVYTECTTSCLETQCCETATCTCWPYC